MNAMDETWELTDLLGEKIEQWKTEGLSKRKVSQYQMFLKTMRTKRMCDV